MFSALKQATKFERPLQHVNLKYRSKLHDSKFSMKLMLMTGVKNFKLISQRSCKYNKCRKVKNLEDESTALRFSENFHAKDTCNA